MEGNIIVELLGMLKQMPWYVMVVYIVGIIIQLMIIFFFLALFPPLVKALFTADFGAICICIYTCFQEEKADQNIIALMIIFLILFALLFFIIGGTDETYSGVVSMFFGSLLEGAFNLLIICMCFTVMLIPFAAMIYSRNERYS